MQLNPEFISNLQEIHGAAGDQWLRELPALIQELASAWDFEFLWPMPCLSYNFVGLVKLRATNGFAVLKLMPQGVNVIREMKWLASIEKGVPKVYVSDETRRAFLMEYLEPGQPLKTLVQAGADDAATKIICETIRSLQAQQHAEFNFPHLSGEASALAILKGQWNDRLLSQAQTWFQELTEDRSQDVVLHGDLHHDNILSSGSGWKAIDPHGYLGDPAAETGAMIRNPLDCFPKNQPLIKVLEQRLRLMSEELPFDPQRIKAWTFCLTVLSAAWTLEGHGRLPALEVEVAAAIDQIKL